MTKVKLRFQTESIGSGNYSGVEVQLLVEFKSKIVKSSRTWVKFKAKIRNDLSL